MYLENEKKIEGTIEVEYVKDTNMKNQFNEDNVTCHIFISCIKNMMLKIDVSDGESHVERVSLVQ